MMGKRKRAGWFALGVLIGASCFTTGAAEKAKTPEKPKPSAKQAPKFSPEERQQRRQVIKERLARQVTDLQKKRTTGTLSDAEQKRLNRLEELSARLQGATEAPPGGVHASPAKPAGKPKPNARQN
jgi:hypothetical protein